MHYMIIRFQKSPALWWIFLSWKKRRKNYIINFFICTQNSKVGKKFFKRRCGTTQYTNTSLIARIIQFLYLGTISKQKGNHNLKWIWDWDYWRIWKIKHCAIVAVSGQKRSTGKTEILLWALLTHHFLLHFSRVVKLGNSITHF